MIGQTLGHYRIEAKLGEGGMGVVYRATDTHLDRPVAIKVLRAEATADADRKRRFVQEAKAASALNHPNIITIHDISNEDGTDFIVMEYVKGQALEQLIGRKGLALKEALRYAVQVADALAKAHAAGLVHRDLKPANVMVSEEGLVKVVDFGLAKLAEQPQEQEAGATQTLAGRTEEGVIVGTVAYMSPEQAEGKKVDARSDIFSFGSVLYEMVSGRKAFVGETKMSTLSAVLHQEPLPLEGVPGELERVLALCLRKDPARRMQHMDDVKVALEQLQEDSESGRLALPASPRPRVWASRRLLFGGVFLLVAATAGVTWWLSRSREPVWAPVLTRLTSDAGLAAYPALSRDGKLLAFASDRGGEGNLDIWMQQIGGGAPLRLTRNEADDTQPAFSADGTKIAFRSEREGGGIYVVPALGGLEQRITEQGRNPRFSPDGNWIAYWVGDLSFFGRRRMYVVPATGGQPREVRPEFHSASFPLWSSNGKHLMFLGVQNPRKGLQDDIFDWWVTPLDGGGAERTGAYQFLLGKKIEVLGKDPGDWTDDHIYFSAGREDSAGLWRIAISRNWRVVGAPERLTAGTGVDVQASAVGDAKGRVRTVFASQLSNADLWSLTLKGGQVAGEPQRLTANIAADTYPSPSADGKRVAFLSNRSGNGAVWIKDLDTGAETALTAAPFSEMLPILSPDGSRMAYAAFEGSKTPIYIASTRGAGARKVMEDSPGPFQHWSPDGTRLLYRKGPAVVSRKVDSGEETVLLQHPKYIVTASRFSADGRWVAFQTVVGPVQRQLFVAPLHGDQAVEEKDWIAITDGSGLDRNAAWSPDGNTLYFLSERDGFRCFWAQALDSLTKRPAGAVQALCHFHQARRSLMSYPEVGMIGMAATRDRIIFSMAETTGNIWMAELR